MTSNDRRAGRYASPPCMAGEVAPLDAIVTEAGVQVEKGGAP